MTRSTRLTKAEYDASLAAAYNLGRCDATAATGIQATPRVKGLASSLGVDLAKVKGTGVAGRVTPGDVRAAAHRSAPQPAVAEDAYPAHWDRSPIDANATDGKSAAEATGPRPGRHAGTAYPADWKL